MLRQVDGVLQGLYRDSVSQTQAEILLLALHAALSNQMRTPRCWLREGNPYFFDYLFGPSSERVEAESHKTLRAASLCPEALFHLRGQDKEIALQMTEEALQELLGQGKMYYDCLRHTPFCHTRDLWDLAQEEGILLPATLEQSLQKRLDQARRTHNQFATHLQRSSDRIWPCAWLDSLRGKINRSWMLHWERSEAYADTGSPDLILGLLLADDL